MPSRNSNLVEAVVRELAVVMAEAVEVAEVATNTDHRVVTATHHQAGKASAVNCGTLHPLRQCPAYGQNCYTCGKSSHYSRYCRSKHRSSMPGRRSRQEMHKLEPDEEYEYDTIQIIPKVKFSYSCHKEHDSNKNNVMFDEIADVP